MSLRKSVASARRPRIKQPAGASATAVFLRGGAHANPVQRAFRQRPKSRLLTVASTGES